MVDVFAADRRVQYMRGGRTEVAAVQVAKNARRADGGRLVYAVARVDRLHSLEQEQTGARAYATYRNLAQLPAEVMERSLQWFASMSVTCTPPVSGMVVAMSSGSACTHFGSTLSMWMIKFAVPSEQ